MANTEYFCGIYTYLGPDKSFLVTFIQFPKILNEYYILSRNAMEENLFFPISTQMRQINVVNCSRLHS